MINSSSMLQYLILIILAMMFALGFLRKNAKSNKRKINQASYGNASRLEIIGQATFQKKQLMNKSEYKLFCHLSKLLTENHPKDRYLLFCQVAMGEFMGSENQPAFKLINSKRVDFLIIDRYGHPIVVIEFQGAGHYQEDAIERDAIKKEACRKAGIQYIEFVEPDDPLNLQRISQWLNTRAHVKDDANNGIT